MGTYAEEIRRPPAGARAGAAAVTREAIQEYLKALSARGRSTATVKMYTAKLRAFYDYLPPDKLVFPETLSAWRDILLKHGYSPGTVNTHLSAANGLLEHMGRRDLQLLERLETEPDAQPELTRTEYLRLLQTAKALERERTYLMVKAFALTGVRVGQLALVTAEAVEGETGLTVYGFLPPLPACALESRHLGLVTAGEVKDLREKLQRLAAQAEESLDLAGLLALARTAPALEPPAAALPEPVGGRPRIAVAKDRAFCFYYADGLALLEQLGAELAEFSPLADEKLPEGTCGLYLGGGYPELFAKELSENAPMRAAIRAAVAAGLPTVAECGGFLYLGERLADGEGRAWPMAGALPGAAENTGRLGRFGYVTLEAQRGGLLGPAGTKLPAHEFHYWDSTAPGADFRAEKPRSTRSWACGYHTPTLYAGFPHFHFCAVPQAARDFVAAARRYGEASQ